MTIVFGRCADWVTRSAVPIFSSESIARSFIALYTLTAFGDTSSSMPIDGPGLATPRGR